MANLLLDPMLWDGVWPYMTPPPDQRNGTTYSVSYDDSTTMTWELAFISSWEAGDTFAGTITVNTAPDDVTDIYLVHMLSDSPYTTLNSVLLTRGVPTDFSYEAASGSMFTLAYTPNPGGALGAFYYGLELTLLPTTPGNYFVYEMEKGWSFDGNYIPHMLELNWLFGEDPFTYDQIQKIRIHGLVKGVVNLQVSMAGMQEAPATDYIPDYMDPQFIDLPFTPIFVTPDFVSSTNYVDYSNRGLALLMKFEGRNTDITKPEPSHVIQVLALQSSPTGNGKSAN